MGFLMLCGACERHVRSDESTCPFCSAALEPAPPPPMPKRRLNRAATFAFGAAIAGATACGGTHSGTDAGEETDAGSVEEDAGNVAPPYGTPADGGFDAGPIAQPYGAPPDDAGGGPAPLYGGAPGD